MTKYAVKKAITEELEQIISMTEHQDVKNSEKIVI